MKALVKKEAKQGLWLEDVPKPTHGINDVLIRVHKTGICGTDVHIYNWDDWAQKTIPGTDVLLDMNLSVRLWKSVRTLTTFTQAIS